MARSRNSALEPAALLHKKLFLVITPCFRFIRLSLIAWRELPSGCCASIAALCSLPLQLTLQSESIFTFLGADKMILLVLEAALSGLILLGIYHFLDRKRVPKDYDPQVDWWIAGLFVFAPKMIIWLLAAGLAIFELPTKLVLLGYCLYIVIPFGMLKFMLFFDTQRALKFALFVPVTGLLFEVIFFMLLHDSMT
jgi:hypothetical protein